MPGWFGFWGWGPRYTLEITPLAMLPLGYVLKGAQRKLVRYLSIGVGTFSILIQLAGCLTNWHARLGYLLEKNGMNAVLFDIRYSQWWDSLKTLFINIWNLLFRRLLYIENSGYDLRISEASWYMSNTICTWWNRIYFLGVNPIYIIIYLCISVTIALYCLKSINNLIDKNNSYIYI